MALRQVNGDVALPAAARGTGTFNSGNIATPSAATHALLMVHVNAASGTGPTLNVSLEQSADGATWAAIPNSGITQLAAVGNAVSTANATQAYLRVTATVAGTTPSFTFQATVVVFGD